MLIMLKKKTTKNQYPKELCDNMDGTGGYYAK